jgi:TonB-dependent receptor
MRTRSVVSALAVALAWLPAVPVCAQQTGGITGRVRSPEGDPLESARVLLVDAGREVITSRGGVFRLPDVPAGRQTLVVAYVGYRPDTTTVEVVSGEVTSVSVSLAHSPVALRGIEVVGERGAQLRAINEQRLAQTVVNVIPADEIGKLPDQNVAEATQRVAGVSIQTSRGEGRFVSIRGTAPELNNVTFNGQPLASTAGSRATALDLLPAAMVSAIEVTKAVTPDMDGNAVGGTVNIETLSALDRDRPFLFGSMRGMSHQQQADYLDDKLPFEAELTGGRRFGAEGALGVVVAGSMSRRDFTASVLDPDGWQEEHGSIIPEELELQVEDNERERYGLSTNLDWRASPASSLFLRGLYTRTREVTSNSEYEFGFEGDLTMETATVGRYTAGSAELDLSEDDELENLLAATIGLEQRLSERLLWDVSGTFTRGTLDRVGPDATFETADEDRLSNVFDVEPYFFTIEPDDAAFVGDPSNYPLRSASWGIAHNRENTWAATTNLRFDTRIGALPAQLQVGGKLQQRDKRIDHQSFAYEPIGVDLRPYALPATGTVQGGSEAFVHGDVARFSRFFGQNRNNPQYFTLDAEETALNEVESDSDNLERVVAGFLMGTVDIGRVTLLAGARVERTETEARRYEFSQDEDVGDIAVNSRTFDNAYTNILPAVVLKLAPSDRVVLRAAWTNTIGRPDYDELSGFREFTFEATSVPGVFDGSVQEGNPDLAPYAASSIDVTAEYYFPLGGLLALGGFHKNIDNPIYEWDITRRGITFEGRFFDEIRFRQDRNADAGTLRGIELQYSQPLFFLPGLLGGLGVTANAAFIDSEVSVPGRDGERLPFFGQSDRVFNVIPYFQRGPVELRLAWSYRGDYLDEIGEESFEDRYGDARETIDVTGRYTFLRDRIELFAQVRNLTNEAEVGYQGIRTRYDVHTLTGRTFTIGLSASY